MKEFDKIEPSVIAAISGAIELFYESAAFEEIQPPPYIILPSVLASPLSPWRFVGRNDAMNSRNMVQMKALRW